MASRACKHWHTVATDDKSWMYAFMHRFGGRPCIRTCESWQSEYLAHHRFIHDWTLGRFENSQKDPRVGFISDIAVYDEQIMATSIETGSICHFTSTGKLIRDQVDVHIDDEQIPATKIVTSRYGRVNEGIA